MTMISIYPSRQYQHNIEEMDYLSRQIGSCIIILLLGCNVRSEKLLDRLFLSLIGTTNLCVWISSLKVAGEE